MTEGRFVKPYEYDKIKPWIFGKEMVFRVANSERIHWFCVYLKMIFTHMVPPWLLLKPMHLRRIPPDPCDLLHIPWCCRKFGKPWVHHKWQVTAVIPHDLTPMTGDKKTHKLNVILHTYSPLTATIFQTGETKNWPKNTSKTVRLHNNIPIDHLIQKRFQCTFCDIGVGTNQTATISKQILKGSFHLDKAWVRPWLKNESSRERLSLRDWMSLLNSNEERVLTQTFGALVNDLTKNCCGFCNCISPFRAETREVKMLRKFNIWNSRSIINTPF